MNWKKENIFGREKRWAKPVNILLWRRMTMGLRWATCWVLQEEQHTVEMWAGGNGNRGWCQFVDGLSTMLMSPDFRMVWANLCFRDRHVQGVESGDRVLKHGSIWKEILCRPMVGNGGDKWKRWKCENVTEKEEEYLKSKGLYQNRKNVIHWVSRNPGEGTLLGGATHWEEAVGGYVGCGSRMWRSYHSQHVGREGAKG